MTEFKAGDLVRLKDEHAEFAKRCELIGNLTVESVSNLGGMPVVKFKDHWADAFAYRLEHVTPDPEPTAQVFDFAAYAKGVQDTLDDDFEDDVPHVGMVLNITVNGDLVVNL